MDTATDEWAIETVEVTVPEQYVRQRAPLLVDLPCPPLAAAPAERSDFECEVMQTAELARCMSLSPVVIRVRARRFGWCAVAATAVTVGTIAVPVAIWFGTIPVALAAGFGWQWAVLTGAAERLEHRDGGA
jgi:hypothetical protein